MQTVTLSFIFFPPFFVHIKRKRERSEDKVILKAGLVDVFDGPKLATNKLIYRKLSNELGHLGVLYSLSLLSVRFSFSPSLGYERRRLLPRIIISISVCLCIIRLKAKRERERVCIFPKNEQSKRASDEQSSCFLLSCFSRLMHNQRVFN